jgi:formate dehydrogenase major subunit/formate dehydrogenase alpha subunit
VGALYDKMSLGKGRPGQITKIRTTCSYCGVGCNFDLNVRDGRVIRVTSAADAPVNGMALCVKGRYGYDYVNHSGRLTRPLVRARWLDKVDQELAAGRWELARVPERRTNRRGPGQDGTDGASETAETFIAVDWDTALDVVARKLAAEKAAHGGPAFAMLTSAKCTNEENYLIAKLTRQLMATNSIDHCARL